MTNPAASHAHGVTPELLADPVLAATIQVADELLQPHADETAQAGVPRSHLDALAAAGTLGLAGYRPSRGALSPADEQLLRDRLLREATEVLAAADGATWFVAAQHHQPLREVMNSVNADLREQWLDKLTTGRALSGIAVSHLARTGPPAVTATPSPGGGWRLDGRITWFTGWGLADVMLLGAATPDDQALLVLLPCATLAVSPGVVHHHDLWSMHATHAVSIDLHAIPAGPDQVVACPTRTDWLRAYTHRTVNTHPAVFGCLRATTTFLRDHAARTNPVCADHGGFAQLATKITQRADTLRERAYHLCDRVPPGQAHQERLSVRAASVDLAFRAAGACLAAVGARSMQRNSTAARLAAEASFHLVHGQTSEARSLHAQQLLIPPGGGA
ncbi:hypothetical protein ACIHCQ_28305 [Streptomyces sp. NPDC052236]|uniref:hypothetical protein n=1 Tax=Streptomyces sp. NPDC052236 TaxID=3365686 RepID=UPI0037D1F882